MEPVRGRRPYAAPTRASRRWGRRRTRGILLALSALALQAAGADAQQSVQGRITDTATGAGIPEAQVTAFVGDSVVARALTGADGRYQLPLPRPGVHVLRVTALGYRPASMTGVNVRAGASATADLVMEPLPLVLEEVRAAPGRDPRRGHQRILERQVLGKGTYVPGAVVANVRPSSLTQYLAELTGLWVRYDRAGNPYLWSPEGPYNCLIAQVNHWPMQDSGYHSFDEIRLERIAAIEVYNTFRDIPPEPQLLALVDDPRRCPCGRCGLVNIWTWNAW